MAIPIANILHTETIRRLSGDGAFERGRSYFQDGRVGELQRKDGAVFSKVRGTEPYAVRIWMKDDSLAYSCSCPQGQEQAFCKHAVAVALASVGADSVLSNVTIAKPAIERPAERAVERPAVERPVEKPTPAPPPPPPPVASSRPAPAPLPSPAPKPSSRPPEPAPRRSLATALRSLSREELVLLILESALDDDAFRDRLTERLREGP